MTVRKIPSNEIDEESRHWCNQVAGMIIRARKERGWSQKVLAQHLGVTQTTVGKMERNPDDVTAKRLFAAVYLLDLSLPHRSSGSGAPEQIPCASQLVCPTTLATAKSIKIDGVGYTFCHTDDTLVRKDVAKSRRASQKANLVREAKAEHARSQAEIAKSNALQTSFGF